MQLGLSLLLTHEKKHCCITEQWCETLLACPLCSPACRVRSCLHSGVCRIECNVHVKYWSHCPVHLYSGDKNGWRWGPELIKKWCIALPYKGKCELALLLCPGFPWAEMKPAHCSWHGKKTRWPGESLALTFLKLHPQWIPSVLEYSESQRLQGDHGYLLSSSAAQTHVHYVTES